MKCYALFAAAALAVAAPCQAQIIVSEVHPTGSATITYMADWFELTNIGGAPVSIANWVMDDNTNTFGSGVTLTGVPTIQPGQSVVFVEGSAATATALTAAWFGASVPAGFTIGTYSGGGVSLGSGGDQVNIFDSLGVAIVSVGFGGATTAVTFDNAAGMSGMISQLSAVGVNGAFTSFTGNEVGSPGTIVTVPEPSSMILAGLAIAGLAGRRIRRRLRSESKA